MSVNVMVSPQTSESFPEPYPFDLPPREALDTTFGVNAEPEDEFADFELAAIAALEALMADPDIEGHEEAEDRIAKVLEAEGPVSKQTRDLHLLAEERTSLTAKERFLNIPDRPTPRTVAIIYDNNIKPSAQWAESADGYELVMEPIAQSNSRFQKFRAKLGAHLAMFGAIIDKVAADAVISVTHESVMNITQVCSLEDGYVLVALTENSTIAVTAMGVVNPEGEHQEEYHADQRGRGWGMLAGFGECSKWPLNSEGEPIGYASTCIIQTGVSMNNTIQDLGGNVHQPALETPHRLAITAAPARQAITGTPTRLALTTIPPPLEIER